MMMELGLIFLGLGLFLVLMLHLIPQLYLKNTLFLGVNGIIVGGLICLGSILVDAVPKLTFVMWGLVAVMMVWTMFLSAHTVDIGGFEND